jgi:methionyl-tRNA formyltransferase
LRRLLEGEHPVVAVVSQPDRPRGRGQRVVPAPVAQVAEAAGVPLLRPERIADAGCTGWLAERKPDLGVVVAFGQFLPRRVRELPSLGYLINAHASLLPRWRGAAPIARAILAGDAETGISVMRLEREMDAGPVLLVRTTAIGPDETAGELGARLAALAADAIAEAVARIAGERAQWTPQDASRATLAPRLERGEAELDFGETAAALVRRVRAMAPRPGAFTWWEGEPLRILAAAALPGPVAAAPGVVRSDGEPPLRVATADGWLAPRVLQRAGGRPLSVQDFVRGRALPDGARLGRAA